MQGIVTVIDSIARFVAIMGLSMAGIFFVYAGILFITAAGDPQKVAQARTALIGTFVGTVIVGVGFLLPGIVSRTIIEPSGGIRLHEGISSQDCDGMLRQQLVIQRGANTTYRMNRVIDRIQGRFEACSPDLWDPNLFDEGDGFSSTASLLCGESIAGGWRVGALSLPPGLLDGGTHIKAETHRDGSNNILVIWEVTGTVSHRPWDESDCWIYFGLYDTWRSG